jgi:hypothetical protein
MQESKVILLVILIIRAITSTNGELPPATSLTSQEIYLVRCLTHISYRYFAPGRSVAISSPSTYRDVQQELIAESHRTATWPVVVTVDGNISMPNKTDFIDKDGSYIILIPDGNIKSLVVEISGLALRRERTFTRFWNYEARFVVAGANEFSMSQQIDIFEYLSSSRIYNCIIVSREHHVMDKEYSRPIRVNDVDTGLKLGVYTWFPYQSSDRCDNLVDITLLDSWVISAQGNFNKNTDLFPRKIGNSFNGCPLKVGVMDGQWEFTTQYFKKPGSDVTYIRGLEVALLQIVLEQTNMSFVYVPITKVSKKEELFDVSDLVKRMLGKEIYIALGAVGTHYMGNAFLDSTNPHYMMTFSWYVPCFDKYPRWSSIFRILSVELWLVLMISIVTAAILATLFGRYSCTSEWQVYKTVASSLTNVWAVIVGVSVSTMPRTSSLRWLFLAWVSFSVAFSTAFQAFLTTYLIDSGYKTPIQNMDELYASGIGLAYQEEHNSFFYEFEKIEASNIKRNRVNCPSFGVCMYWAKYHKNVSILLVDAAAWEQYALGYFIGENSEPLVCRLEDGVVYTTGLSMVMYHGDPLMKRVTEIIDRVVEAGIYSYEISLHMNRIKIKAHRIAIANPFDGYYSFNLYHMQPAFYLLLMGCCLSAICFIVELLCYRVLSK